MSGQTDVQAQFLRYGPEIRTFLIRRIACSETVADLTQETFVRLLCASASETINDVRAWLYRTAGNLAIDHHRKEHFRQTFPTSHEAMADIPGNAASEEDVVAGRERLTALRRALDELPARTREIFTLNRVEGLTYAEVAHRLGVSESTVQKHLAHGLDHVMKRIIAFDRNR